MVSALIKKKKKRPRKGPFTASVRDGRRNGTTNASDTETDDNIVHDADRTVCFVLALHRAERVYALDHPADGGAVAVPPPAATVALLAVVLLVVVVHELLLSAGIGYPA